MKSKVDFNISEAKVFIGVLAIISVVFVWILIPFAAPIFWASVLAVLFYPMHRKLLTRMPEATNIAALISLSIAVLVVVIPISMILSSLVAETTVLYKRFEDGEINIGDYIDQITAAFPLVQSKLESFDISLEELKQHLRQGFSIAANFITKQSFQIGQNTLAFFLNLLLMLYLTFFMLRDGPLMLHGIKVAFPLDDEREAHLFAKFSEVSRATVKGNLVVGIVQGALGGFIFWALGVQSPLLWGTVMAVASLIPAIGTGLVWVPVAVYFIAVGEYLDAFILTAFGVFVIGLVDNLLRPILVGRDTKLPDYIVLITTLGGIGLVGIQGVVVGPLIAVLFFTLWAMFVAEFNPDEAHSVQALNEQQSDKSEP